MRARHNYDAKTDYAMPQCHNATMNTTRIQYNDTMNTALIQHRCDAMTCATSMQDKIMQQCDHLSTLIIFNSEAEE